MRKIKKRKSIRIAVRVSPEERAIFREKSLAADITLSEAVRQSIIRARIYQRDQEFLFQFNKVALGLNQIAAKCTSTGIIDIAVLIQLRTIEKLVVKLL